MICRLVKVSPHGLRHFCLEHYGQQVTGATVTLNGHWSRLSPPGAEAGEWGRREDTILTDSRQGPRGCPPRRVGTLPPGVPPFHAVLCSLTTWQRYSRPSPCLCISLHHLPASSKPEMADQLVHSKNTDRASLPSPPVPLRRHLVNHVAPLLLNLQGLPSAVSKLLHLHSWLILM